MKREYQEDVHPDDTVPSSMNDVRIKDIDAQYLLKTYGSDVEDAGNFEREIQTAVYRILVTCRADLPAFRTWTRSMEKIMREYFELLLDVYSRVPEAVRDTLWTISWENAHAEGYAAIYYEMDQLMGLFPEPPQTIAEGNARQRAAQCSGVQRGKYACGLCGKVHKEKQ